MTITGCEKWHEYTVSFLCWRIWEEINMYNHTTNAWTSEHLRQLDSRHPAAWAYLQKWLEDWCVANPATNVVRLTSLFYNFVWIFGDDMRLRNRFVDWASYDYTVSVAALKAFEAEYGYALTAENFINQGKLQVTHMPPTKAKKDVYLSDCAEVETAYFRRTACWWCSTTPRSPWTAPCTPRTAMETKRQVNRIRAAARCECAAAFFVWNGLIRQFASDDSSPKGESQDCQKSLSLGSVIRRRQTANRKSATCAAIFARFCLQNRFLTRRNGRQGSSQP